MEKSLSEQLEDLIAGSFEESVINSYIRAAIKELKRQDVIIDFLYGSLGPANDEILDMACEEADRLYPSE